MGGGQNNNATQQNSTIGGGKNNKASGFYSTISGGEGAVADKWGQNAYASGGFDDIAGNAQTSVFVARYQTTNTTETNLRLDGNNQYMTLNDQDAWTFKALVIGKNNSGSIYGSYEIRGIIINNSGTLTINGVSSVANRTIYETNANLDATAVINGTALSIQVKGLAGVTIHWVARVEVAQVNY